MPTLNGCHHITLCVGKAQEDVDFHVKTLGLRFIKRTVLFDGKVPVYHLYYSNQNGDPGSIVTTFPFHQAGIFGRRGTNQAREVLLSVPSGSLDFWQRRLNDRNIATTAFDALNTRRLGFLHPSGIDYVLVGVDGDSREGHAGYGVPKECAIHGVYGVGVHVHTPDLAVEFAEKYLAGHDSINEAGRFAINTGAAGQGGAIELTVNRSDDEGSWIYGGGTIHHFAFNAVDLVNQDALKFEIEGAGYTDISELKDRKYFKSVYVRSPGGLLCELAVTHPEGGWTCDESPQELGKRFLLPRQFEAQREEFLGRLEKIEI
jgi:glyoxalase family protein